MQRKPDQLHAEQRWLNKIIPSKTGKPEGCSSVLGTLVLSRHRLNSKPRLSIILSDSVVKRRSIQYVIKLGHGYNWFYYHWARQRRQL